MYIVSGDTPEEQLLLYNALKERFGYSLPFVSDPDLELIDLFGMKNGDAAYRGYGLLDTDGTVVFHTVNDLWGEQFDKTVKEIKEEYKAIEQ
jgi:alkyl hydroperoxide reductase subunit AhpC